MPRLKDLLEYLARPGVEHLWLLLDIKLDNNMDDVKRLIGSTIADVKPSRPWIERIILGCWTAALIPKCIEYLPGFSISHIGFSISYASRLLSVPNISFNMFQKAMVGPRGNRFIKKCQAAERPVFLWTVNEEGWMRWSIGKGVDGVITDDPKKFLDVCDTFDWSAPLYKITMRDYGTLAFFQILIMVFGSLFKFRHGFTVDVAQLRRKIKLTQEGSISKLS